VHERQFQVDERLVHERQFQANERQFQANLKLSFVHESFQPEIVFRATSLSCTSVTEPVVPIRKTISLVSVCLKILSVLIVTGLSQVFFSTH